MAVDNTIQTEKEPVWAEIEKNPLLNQIAAYIKANQAGKVTLKAVAEHFEVSISTVTQLFQKKIRITFHDFLTECRMEQARVLILQGTPLEIVGKEVGYRDHSTFYRAFRRKFGVSPREYRKRILQTEKE